MIELDVSNYRGALQIKEESGKYFWRVNSDVHDKEWIEIPVSLYKELVAQNEREEEKNDEHLYKISLGDSRS